MHTTVSAILDTRSEHAARIHKEDSADLYKMIPIIISEAVVVGPSGKYVHAPEYCSKLLLERPCPQYFENERKRMIFSTLDDVMAQMHMDGMRRADARTIDMLNEAVKYIWRKGYKVGERCDFNPETGLYLPRAAENWNNRYRTKVKSLEWTFWVTLNPFDVTQYMGIMFGLFENAEYIGAMQAKFQRSFGVNSTQQSQ